MQLVNGITMALQLQQGAALTFELGVMMMCPSKPKVSYQLVLVYGSFGFGGLPVWHICTLLPGQI